MQSEFQHHAGRKSCRGMQKRVAKELVAGSTTTTTTTTVATTITTTSELDNVKIVYN